MMLTVFLIAGIICSGALAVSAEEGEASSLGKPAMLLHYVDEVIFLDDSGRMPEGYFSEDKTVVLMYALKVKSTDSNDLQKAKWLPTYSGAIDISKYVPKKAGGSPYTIAFRWSDQPAKKENVFTVTLEPRQTIAKGDVWYDADKQRVMAKGEGFEVKIGDDVWYDNEPDSDWGKSIGDNGLWLPMSFMPTGGVVTARKSPVYEDGGEDTKGQFASPILKIKLPKPTKAVDANKVSIKPKTTKTPAYLAGVSEKMEVLVNETLDSNEQRTEVWKPLKRNMTVAEFDKLFESGFSGKDTTSAAGNYSFRVRNRAAGAKPASPETVLEFDQEKYDEALVVNEPE
jgi:hypothetical protein